MLPQLAKLIQKATREQEGDLLVFLPGAAEILKLAELLSEISGDIQVFPLFGDLPQKQQQDAISPSQNGRRKIVLATSIAETSLTIEGVRIVIDSGLARTLRFDPKLGLSKLETTQLTKDAAYQPAGKSRPFRPRILLPLLE